jgi:hypothetical protein
LSGSSSGASLFYCAAGFSPSIKAAVLPLPPLEIDRLI